MGYPQPVGPQPLTRVTDKVEREDEAAETPRQELRRTTHSYGHPQ
jgi:hypothetical protein